MIPETQLNFENLELTVQPSLTYGIDLINKRVIHKVDGLDALTQSVGKILNTERFAYVIYKNYGVALEGLIGQDIDFVKSVLEPRIRDALMQDDRIEEVEDIELKHETGSIFISFNVRSHFGFFNIEKEVMV